jgi:hypothetical protein
MSLLRHIRRCNDWDQARFRPLLRGAARIGWIREDHAPRLARFPSVFSVGTDAVQLVAEGDAEAVTRAVDEALETLVGEGVLPKWRYEEFPVLRRWGEAPLFRVDRGAVPFLGARAYGVHVNGLRRDRDGLKLWIGRRAPDKKVDPDKLDNIVAGGIGAGHGIEDTLLKEGQEEADLSPSLLEKAIPVGAITYRRANDVGTRDDVLFVYDLEMPPDVTPKNTDGEIVSFALRSAADVVDEVRRTDEYKFNVNLVIIDFALRHGLVSTRDPEYLDLVTGLRRPLD